MKKQNSILVVSDQLEQVDRIENALKDKVVLNLHKATSIAEIRHILSNETLELVLLDSTEGSLPTAAVRGAIKDLKQEVPILQMRADNSDKSAGEYLKNGATAVCSAEDLLDLATMTLLLISEYTQAQKQATAQQHLDQYRKLFSELYNSLADPICYVNEGMFVSANPAFLRTFELTETELSEMTIMNLVERKDHGDFKTHLRKSKTRDLSSSPVSFEMKTKLGKDVEMLLMSKPCLFEEEEVIQLYLRTAASGGGGLATSLFDQTTGLMNREQMLFFLQQTIDKFKDNGDSGQLCYLYIRNYRDVWGSDGMEEAEKFIKSVGQHIKEFAPARTELCRYTDDGIVAFLPATDSSEAEEALKNLIKKLDYVTPDGMLRMVEPLCYGSFVPLDQNSHADTLVSKLFRSVRAAALSDGLRVTEPTDLEVAKRDVGRVNEVKEVLRGDQLRLRYQPVASFEPGNLHRYQVLINVEGFEGEEREKLFVTASRYDLLREFDEWRLKKVFENLLALKAEARNVLKLFIPISEDSLNNPNFLKNLNELFKNTRLPPDMFVFELSVDTVQNAYSAAIKLADFLHKIKSALLIEGIGILNKEATRVINDSRPNYLKVDIREIDTLEDAEEKEAMTELVELANAQSATIIAGNIESPSQLARIWPYDIKFVQGPAMTPVLEKMNFNFKEFTI